ncbi:hypothetical protein P3S68_016023 [Capsicum galapagoense]
MFSNKQKGKRICSEERNDKIKQRRCEMYRAMPADKREKNLLQRRRASIQSRPQNPSSNFLGMAASSEFNSHLIREKLDRTPPSCPLQETAALIFGIEKVCSVINSTVHHPDRNLINGSSVFEIGSTSKQDDSTIEHCVTNRGRRSRVFRYCSITDLPNNPFKLKIVPNYKFCKAKRFQYESPGFCCANGSVKLIHYELPVELVNLYLGNSEESKHFRTYIRMYNNMFAFTSLGVNCDKNLATKNYGIYTFRVQGKMYHFIDDLVPSNRSAKNIQLYFYNTDNELVNRMAFSDNLNESVIKTLMDILKIGKKSFLPISFTGGPRDMRRRYMNAIALVQHYGKPNIFMTMTCYYIIRQSVAAQADMTPSTCLLEKKKILS